MDVIVKFCEVEQQTKHVCAYFAVGNGIRALLKKPTDYVPPGLPPRESWSVDVHPTDVEKMIKTVAEQFLPMCIATHYVGDIS